MPEALSEVCALGVTAPGGGGAADMAAGWIIDQPAGTQWFTGATRVTEVPAFNFSTWVPS